MLDKEHCHATLNGITGNTAHHLTALGIQSDGHLGHAVLIKGSLSVGNTGAGDDDVLLQGSLAIRVVTEAMDFGVGTAGIRQRFEAELQVGGLADNALGGRRILHARQLYHNTVTTLTLYQRLGHTQLVDAVAQRGQVLFDRVVFNLANGLLGQVDVEPGIAIYFNTVDQKLLIGAKQQAGGTVTCLGIHETDCQTTIVQMLDHTVAQFFLTQLGLDLADIDIQTLADRLCHVHFQQEVHTATQVQAQLHRSGAEAVEPFRCGRCQVQGDDILATQLIRDRLLGRKLGVGAGQAHQCHAILLHLGAFHLDAGGFQCGLDPGQGAGIDFSGPSPGNLHGIIIGIQVGGCIQAGNDQHQQDQQIFPQGVAVEHRAPSSPKTKAPPEQWRWITQFRGSDTLDRALGQFRCHVCFLELELGTFGDFQHHVVVGQASHLADDAAGGDHFITLGQTRDQVFVLFGTLGLGAPHEEVENQTKADQKQDVEHARIGCACRGVSGQRRRDEKAHSGCTPGYGKKVTVMCWFHAVSGGVSCPR